jgi:hypothetical protein
MMACEGSLFNISRRSHEQLYEYINLLHISIYMLHTGTSDSAPAIYCGWPKKGGEFPLAVGGGGGRGEQKERDRE